MVKFFIISIVVLFFNQNIFAKDTPALINEVRIYLNSLSDFSATFIQESDNNLQEGFLYKKNDRIRVDYLHPSKITIILNRKKAMYFNHELEEVEYFNPRKTIAKIVYDIFNSNFIDKFDNHLLEENFVTFYISLKHDEIPYFIEVVFEISPLQLRLVNISSDDENLSFGLRDHNFNNIFDKKFFSMANPLIN